MQIEISRKVNFDPDQGCLIYRKTQSKKHLEPRLVKILATLVESRGYVVERDYLIETIWNNYGSGEQLLTHSISLLRKHLDEDVIKTVPKKGYILEKPANKGYFQNLSLNQGISIGAMILLILKVLFFPHH